MTDDSKATDIKIIRLYDAPIKAVWDAWSDPRQLAEWWTVTFAEENPDQTRVNLIWEPDGTVLPEELETFINARAGMTQGWTGSFNKLDEYLGRVFGASRK
jgi:uncharacterized protein YndB with AHSA1/START domain